MAADLPNEFDVVVLGTGMPESIVAAAFSRIGQTVLHLDRNEFYSGDWASFSLRAIENWVKEHQSDNDGQTEERIKRPDTDENSLLEEGETTMQLPLYNSSFSRAKAKFCVREEENTEDNCSDPVIKDKPENVLSETSSTDNTEDNCSDPVIKDKPETVLSETSSKDNTEDNCSDPVIKDKPETVLSETSSTDNTEVSATKTSVDKSEQKPVELQSDTKEELGQSEQTHKTSEDLVESTTDVFETVQEEDQLLSDKGEKEEAGITGDTEQDNHDLGKQEEGEVVKQVEAGVEKAQTEKPWTVNRLKSEWRKFNIDISPKLLFSSGDMVELLISSDIAKYCEFKTITRILTVLNGQLEVVPCSRAGVFSSKTLSMIEKRMLMKFLQFCAEYENKEEEFADFLDRPFVDFLTSKRLSANVKHYIQHSIAMATQSTTTQQGLCKMRKFLRSLGRYGNTSFLWSLYGSGELPQSFCRMCAVFGGLYCLRMSASSLVVDSDNRCTGIITTEGQKIKCKWLIMENSYAPAGFLSDTKYKTISRAVIMTDRPLLPSGQHELSQMCLPCPDDGDRPVFVLELPPSCLSSPPGVYLFHLTRQGKEGVSAEEDLAYAVNLLFKNEAESQEVKPCVLWSLYFGQRDASQVKPSNNVPANVVLMSGPGMEIDIDRTVQEAKDVFQQILPDVEFLPKAPNPEDIVYIDDEETKVADSNTQSEFSDSDKQKNDDQSGSIDKEIDKSESKDGKTDDQFESKDEKNEKPVLTSNTVKTENPPESEAEEKNEKMSETDDQSTYKDDKKTEEQLKV